MALLFMDTFDHYSTTADLSRKWTGEMSGANQVAVSSTRAGALLYPGGGQTAFQNSGGNNVGLYKTLPSAYATGIVGVWVYFVSLPSSTHHFIAMGDTGGGLGIGNSQITLGGDGAGKLIIYRGGSNGTAGTVLATSVNNLSTGVWYHIEMKVTINNATGAYEVRVNGTSVGWIPAATGANTRNGTNNSFNEIHFNQGTAGVSDLKLVYVCDTTGTSANDFLGVCRGVVLHTSSGGNYSQWTSSTGANFWQVMDSYFIPDGDLSYNASATVNQIDTFNFQDLPSASGTIHAIQHVQQAKQDGGAARSFAPVSRISATDYVATTKFLAGTYTFYMEPVSVSPATGVAWTVAELNAAEFGYKLIS